MNGGDIVPRTDRFDLRIAPLRPARLGQRGLAHRTQP